MYSKLNQFRKYSFWGICALLLLASFQTEFVQAANLTNLSDQMSRMKALTPSNHTIEFTTPNGVAAGETITIDFPAGFSIPVALDYTDMDLADDGVDIDLAGTCSGTTWGADVSGQIITFTSCTGTIGATSVVTVDIGTNTTHQTTGDQQITNPNTSPYSPQLNIDGSMLDSGVMGLGILAEDQIAVTGVLIPALTFTLDTTPLNLGLMLSSGVAGAGPNNMVLATNSPLGYTIAVRDNGNGSTAGFWNSGKSHLIPSVSGLLQAGASEGYGGQCTKISGNGTCHANFAFAGDNVGDFTRTDQIFASFGAPPAGAEDFTITVRAAITDTTPGGTYTDNLTFTATAIY